jgi:hypothetical protein
MTIDWIKQNAMKLFSGGLDAEALDSPAVPMATAAAKQPPNRRSHAQERLQITTVARSSAKFDPTFVHHISGKAWKVLLRASIAVKIAELVMTRNMLPTEYCQAGELLMSSRRRTTCVCLTSQSATTSITAVIK